MAAADKTFYLSEVSMKRVIQTTVLAITAAGAFAVLPGCQNRMHHDDTNRAMPASSTFDRGYVATRDTEAVSAPNSTSADRTRISQGTRVYFDSAPGTSDWQQARVDGKVVYVRPTDFSRAQ
jgi:hypothetical protein